MRRTQLLLVPAACLATLACSDSMSRSDYRLAWRQAVSDYRAVEKDPRLVASSAQANGSDDQVALTQACDTISEQIRDIDNRIKTLKAPSQYEILQQDTELFYLGQANDYQGYASALGEGDAAKIDRAAEELNTDAGDQHHKVEGDIASLGRDADLFRDVWKDALLPPDAAPPLEPVAPPVQAPKPKKPRHRHKK